MSSRPPGDALTTLALSFMAGTLAVGLVLDTAGVIAAIITGLPRPVGGPAVALTILTSPTDPGRALGIPDLPAGIYWLSLPSWLARPPPPDGASGGWPSPPATVFPAGVRGPPAPVRSPGRPAAGRSCVVLRCCGRP